MEEEAAPTKRRSVSSKELSKTSERTNKLTVKKNEQEASARPRGEKKRARSEEDIATAPEKSSKPSKRLKIPAKTSLLLVQEVTVDSGTAKSKPEDLETDDVVRRLQQFSAKLRLTHSRICPREKKRSRPRSVVHEEGQRSSRCRSDKSLFDLRKVIASKRRRRSRGSS